MTSSVNTVERYEYCILIIHCSFHDNIICAGVIVNCTLFLNVDNIPR